MDEYDGAAVIEQGKARVSVSRCIFSSRIEPTSGLRGWSGRFTHGDPSHVLEPGSAALVLPSGERGNIIIDHLYVETPTGGSFVGNGPPPTVPPSDSE